MNKKVFLTTIGLLFLTFSLFNIIKVQALLPDSFGVINNEYFKLKFTEVNSGYEPVNGFNMTTGLTWMIDDLKVNESAGEDYCYGKVFNDSKYYSEGYWTTTNVFPSSEFAFTKYNSSGVYINNASYVVPLVLPTNPRVYNDTLPVKLANNLSTYWKSQINATGYLAWNFTEIMGSMSGIMDLPILPEFVIFAWEGAMLGGMTTPLGWRNGSLLYISMYLTNGTLCYALSAKWGDTTNWSVQYKLLTPWLELFDSMISGMFGMLFPGLPTLDMGSIPGFPIEFVILGFFTISIVVYSIKSKRNNKNLKILS